MSRHRGERVELVGEHGACRGAGHGGHAVRRGLGLAQRGDKALGLIFGGRWCRPRAGAQLRRAPKGRGCVRGRNTGARWHPARPIPPELRGSRRPPSTVRATRAAAGAPPTRCAQQAAWRRRATPTHCSRRRRARRPRRRRQAAVVRRMPHPADALAR
eukprot:scaffold19983_cov26-Tisochrysis_lutea.AAC.5